MLPADVWSDLSERYSESCSECCLEAFFFRTSQHNHHSGLITR